MPPGVNPRHADVANEWKLKRTVRTDDDQTRE
jgi:hypothetical protein